jgi:tRNA-dihydrouridine synthase A
MMDRTDRHFRVLVRQISRRVLLYTEMVTAKAVLHGVREHLIGFDPVEHPISLQLGGDDPAEMAAGARIAEDWGYDEVNINVGCPSDRVQRGRFGACLMAVPEVVAECVDAMRSATRLPITVKTRIGIDDHDRFEDLLRFTEVVAPSGPARFTIHARKAWLSGLSPKQNRTVPPLRYAEVHRLKRTHPEWQVEINGGVLDLEQASEHLRSVDGVMIGRAAYDDPMIFAHADQRFYGEAGPPVARLEAGHRMVPYVARQLERGHRLASVTRHMLGLFKGVPGARGYRRLLSTEGTAAEAGVDVLQRALGCIRPESAAVESARVEPAA